MKNSGIVGMVAVAIGLIGFSLTWVSLGTVTSWTGFDLINRFDLSNLSLSDLRLSGLTDATIIFLLMICGLIASISCFSRRSTGLRIVLAVSGIVIIIQGWIYRDLMTTTVSSTETGLLLVIGTGILLLVAAACGDTK
jgi:hypothetical protein